MRIVALFVVQGAMFAGYFFNEALCIYLNPKVGIPNYRNIEPVLLVCTLDVTLEKRPLVPLFVPRSSSQSFNGGADFTTHWVS